ncbi:Lrp/AsnC family transcriptional regulator [Sciscionella sediminilitoris]|uniref:Lrp/AsnC family transcriptional regulator n=1 Tax=Sciscionella sediminilitoris TaxID=1445613 RepID=UPI0004DFC5B5|nr:Lrp/AsnC family transcriptional regulator [Sciscionella sp. SE31]
MTDDLDRKILHALQLDGRASFRAIGQVIGVSPQTVTRRYAHLRSTAALRILGRTQSFALGDEEWFLRVRCSPDTTVQVARALARHEETVWTHITSGGTEIVCTTRNPEGHESLLLRKLPKTPRVTSVTAHCLLYSYYGGPQNIVDKVRPLSPEQIDALTVAGGPPQPTRITETDRAILAVLYEDGRAGNQQLAAAAGCSQSTAQRRVAELRRAGVLYLDVDYDPRVLARSRLAMLWATVAPAHLEAAGNALAQHDEVSFAASTTGPTNLYAAVNCTDNRALHNYLTGPIATLPGLTQVESAPVARTLKRAGLLRSGDSS